MCGSASENEQKSKAMKKIVETTSSESQLHSRTSSFSDEDFGIWLGL